jgi:superfamily II RNA helicase
MVKLCDKKYPEANEEIYKEHFSKFSFPLSDFQKYAIESTVEGHHVLVTAHTGSGKTLPAEFAIDYFVSKGKKVIYTSPIKALSNQKFYEFSEKFPHISFGILTGDIKTNPEADVLIMTTEILQNTLYLKNRDIVSKSKLHFDMDIQNELACVIFDEIHYINDEDRGKVWEESILMLPPHVQMVMLSATIDKPEKFAEWCENRYQSDKLIYLAPTNFRVVPLNHYVYMDTTTSLFKIIKDKDKEKEIKKSLNTPLVLKKQNQKFSDSNYSLVNKNLSLIRDKKVVIKPHFILNNLIRYLYNNNMLPAICFVFSRYRVEKYAKMINVNLFGYDDAHIPSIIRKDCEKIIRRLPNAQEYLDLPEFNELVSLLEKGIAIHHAGIMPILREMVELTFAKGYIKVLFATETFAVGLNMPTKTVIFTSMNKHSSDGIRDLHSHEYTQMAGRAGRRGLDTIGYVIHCGNLIKDMGMPNLNDYKKILSGVPQVLKSKFKFSYGLILNLISVGNTSFCDFIQKSMLHEQIQNQVESNKLTIQNLQTQLDKQNSILSSLELDLELLDQYEDLLTQFDTVFQSKKRDKIVHNINNFKAAFPSIASNYKIVSKIKDLEASIQREHEDIENTLNYVNTNVQNLLYILETNKFIEKDSDMKYRLTRKGDIASHVHEIHCLLIGDLYEEGYFEDMTTADLVGFFSCFCNLRVTDDYKEFDCPSQYDIISNTVYRSNEIINSYLEHETNYSLHKACENFELQFDFVKYSYIWSSQVNNETQAKTIINEAKACKNIFLGEFIKSLLKINNIAAEFENVCELTNNMKLLQKIKAIPDSTLKYIATNQSLYV